MVSWAPSACGVQTANDDSDSFGGAMGLADGDGKPETMPFMLHRSPPEDFETRDGDEETNLLSR